MSNKVISEIAILDGKFKDAAHRGGFLSLQLSALNRDSNEINERLGQAYQGKEDAVPILKEVRENLTQRAETSKAYRENLIEVEALCRQSADVIGRLISCESGETASVS
jgi:hypothetical protein